MNECDVETSYRSQTSSRKIGKNGNYSIDISYVVLVEMNRPFVRETEMGEIGRSNGTTAGMKTRLEFVVVEM